MATFINQTYATNLKFTNVSVADYLTERKASLVDFIGTIIAGIYEGIKNGDNDVPSDLKKAVGRPHKSALEMISHFS